MTDDVVASATDPSCPPDRSPDVRAPKQERSRRTLGRIVKAALEIVAEEGADALTVHEIVRRADSSVGSFYARFGGKDDLLAYLEHRVWDDVRERWDRGIEEAAWDDATLEEVVEGIVSLLLEVEATDARERRALSRLGSAAPGGERGAEAFRRHIRGDVRELLLARAAEVAHPEPARALDVLFRVLLGAAREVRGEPEAAAELTRMALAYLGVGRPEERSDEAAIDFFDVWG